MHVYLSTYTCAQVFIMMFTLSNLSPSLPHLPSFPVSHCSDSWEYNLEPERSALCLICLTQLAL